MVAFTTFKLKKRRFLVVEEPGNDRFHIIDDEGNNYGSWWKVSNFRKKYQAGVNLSLGRASVSIHPVKKITET